MRVGSLLLNADEFVANYVRVNLGPEVRAAFRDYTAIGIIRRDEFCGGVVYHNFYSMPHGNAVEVSIACSDAGWALPQTLRALFSYPFEQLGCVRMTAIAAKSNTRSRKLIEGLGFKREGSHPRAIDGKEDAISYGLLKEHCRWIKERQRK